MKDLPIAARLFVGAVLAAGAVVFTVFAPHTLNKPGLFFALLLCSSLASAFKVALPLAKSGSTMSVSYAVDFASLLLLGADADDDRRGGERVEPVHVPDADAQSAVPDALQHGEPRADGEGGRPGLRVARRRAADLAVLADARWRGRSSAPRRPTSSATRRSSRRRSGSRPASRSRACGTRTSSGARRATSSARARRRWRRRSSTTAATGWRRSRRRRST